MRHALDNREQRTDRRYLQLRRGRIINALKRERKVARYSGRDADRPLAIRRWPRQRLELYLCSALR